MNSNKFYNWCLDHRHPIFFGGLIFFFLVPELLEKTIFISIPSQIQVGVLVFCSVFIVQASPKKRQATYGVAGILLAFIFIWNGYRDSELIGWSAYILFFIYFSFISYHLFKDILSSKEITVNVVIGVFAGYFLIGVIFFFIFAFLDSFYPDTLNVDMDSPDGIQDVFYFSFITLTTIGYGDFSPTSTLGQKVAILEGLTGQFYLAVVVAVMVSKYISHSGRNK